MAGGGGCGDSQRARAQISDMSAQLFIALICCLQAAPVAIGADCPQISGAFSSTEFDACLASAEVNFKDRVIGGEAAPTQWAVSGVLFMEGVALVAACDYFAVDVLLESGTASGVSTEIMAKYLEPKGTLIRSVDSDEKSWDKAATTAKKLRPYKDVQLIKGNSYVEFPKLLEEFQDKRVGVFVDGPKRRGAQGLCQKMLASPSVQFCAIHDTSIVKGEKRTARFQDTLTKWNQVVFNSFEDKYWDEYKRLDEGNFKLWDSFRKYPRGFGLSIAVQPSAVPETQGGESAGGEIATRGGFRRSRAQSRLQEH